MSPPSRTSLPLPSPSHLSRLSQNMGTGCLFYIKDRPRDAKGTFHAKMGLIKDRNGRDLKKQKILRRGGKNTQNCTNKIFTTKIITMV